MSMLLIWVFDAETTRLIQLYIVGVFVSFNLSQLGMIRHWTPSPADRARPGRAATDDALAGHQHLRARHDRGGAGDRADHQVPRRRLDHDHRDGLLLPDHAGDRTATTTTWSVELAADEQDKVLPTRVHAIVLTSKLHKPTLRALAFAKATRPNVLEGDLRRPPTPLATNKLMEEWDERQHRRPAQGAALAVPRGGAPDRRVRPGDPASPTRAGWSPSTSRSTSWVAGGSSSCTTRPRCGSRAGCCSRPGVMVISVPYQLRSSQIARERERRVEGPDARRRPAPRQRPRRLQADQQTQR